MSLRNVVMPSEIEQVNCESDSSKKLDGDFIYIGNIPQLLKSVDLRFFFMDFVERGAFKCFHYRHRPEQQSNLPGTIESEMTGNSLKSCEKTCCCIALIDKSEIDNFISKYNYKEWRGRTSFFPGKKSNIRKLNISKNKIFDQQYATKSELKKNKHQTDQTIYMDDIKKMLEMNPPELMKHGNVGTPTKLFHQLIRECKLPSKLIKQLGLEFLNSKEKPYGNVPMEYNCSSSTSTGKKTLKDYTEETSCDSSSENKRQKIAPTSSDTETLQEESNERNETEHDDAEDWERYEALHDDVDNQSRPKERLFEEDIELKWEKGGSGLVFYTDSYFWNEMKGKDFDEDTVDDWDVDYSVYYEDGAGDKPSRDQLQMRIEQRRRLGKNEGPVKYSEIKRKEKQSREEKLQKYCDFEKYSNNYGSRILKQHGWKEGDGVGTNKNKGISEPIGLEGMNTRTRSGLGYYGHNVGKCAENAERTAERDVYISTVYDLKDGENIDAMRFHGKELLKYRPVPVPFKSGEKLPAKIMTSNP